MTAFDSDNRTDVSIWFNSGGDEVHITTNLDEPGSATWVHYEEIPAIISDLVDAYVLRGGDFPKLILNLLAERGIR